MKNLLFSLLLILSVITVKAQTQSLSFRILNVDEKTCEVYDWSHINHDHLIIPESAVIDGEEFSVVRIAEGAFKSVGVDSITIPSSIKSIGEYAFSGYGYVSAIVANFASLESLCNIQFENKYSNPMGDKGKLLIAGVEASVVIIPDEIKTISDYAFYGANNITHVILSESVESIGKYAFYNCTDLSYLDMPSSILSIGVGAFGYQERAKSVEVNYPSIESLCKIQFDSAYSNPLVRNGRLLIDGELVDNIIIPNDVTEIRDYMFYGCRSIRQVEIPNSVLSIGECAFYYCMGLKSINVPSSVKKIGRSAFGYNYWDKNEYGGLSLEEASFESIEGLCQIQFGNEESNPIFWTYKLIIDGEEVSNVIVPDGVTEINDYAFYNATNVTSVELPVSLQKIGNYSFYKCRHLNSINLPDFLESIGEGAFIECQLNSITFPHSIKYIGSDAFGQWPNVNKITYVSFASLESLFSIQFGNMCSNPMTTARNLIIDGNEIFNIVIPDDITKINDYTFFNARNLKSIYIPNSVTSIGEGSFMGCTNLKSIIIPGYIENIGKWAFDVGWTMNDDWMQGLDYNLEEIIYDSENPISFSADIFTKSVYQKVVLRMPEKGLEASRNVSPWVLFKNKEILTERLVLNPSEWSGEEGEQFQISALLIPGNLPVESIDWKSSDESVASISEKGLVSVLKPGSCLITATTTDGSNISGECLITSSTGVDCIFPDDNGCYDVYDMNGTLLRMKCDKENLKQLSSGIYIIRTGSVVRKIVITNK